MTTPWNQLELLVLIGAPSPRRMGGFPRSGAPPLPPQNQIELPVMNTHSCASQKLLEPLAMPTAASCCARPVEVASAACADRSEPGGAALHLEPVRTAGDVDNPLLDPL